MTLERLFDMELVKGDTEIYVRDKDMNLLTSGRWFQDKVLDHMEDEIECFTWQDDNRLYIDVK